MYGFERRNSDCCISKVLFTQVAVRKKVDFHVQIPDLDPRQGFAVTWFGKQ